MRVEAVELRRVQIPLKRAFKHALHERKHTDAVFVTVLDAQGKTGWGEVQPRPYVTGETIEGVLEETGPALAQRLLGKTLDGVGEVTAWLDDAAAFVGQGLATLCGFDLALLSLATGGAVEHALGGIRRDPLPPGVIIGFEHETAKLARYCATLRLAGRNHVKVKVGLPDDVGAPARGGQGVEGDARASRCERRVDARGGGRPAARHRRGGPHRVHRAAGGGEGPRRPATHPRGGRGQGHGRRVRLLAGRRSPPRRGAGRRHLQRAVGQERRAVGLAAAGGVRGAGGHRRSPRHHGRGVGGPVGRQRGVREVRRRLRMP